MKEEQIVIKCKIPTSVKYAEIAEYVRDALESWGGSLDPNTDPFFDGLKVISIAVGKSVFDALEVRE